MTDQTTSNTNATDFNNDNEAGAIWIRSSEKGNVLSIMLNGESLTGFENRKKPEGSSQPDYRIQRKLDGKDEKGYDNSELVGAAWKGLSAKGNQTLTIKMDSGEYYNCVMRPVVEGQSENRADMTIFKPTETETPAEPEAAAQKTL